MSEGDVRRAIKAALKESSVRYVARALGLSHTATLALAAGADVRPGSIALAEKNLGRLAERQV